MSLHRRLTLFPTASIVLIGCSLGCPATPGSTRDAAATLRDATTNADAAGHPLDGGSAADRTAGVDTAGQPGPDGSSGTVDGAGADVDGGALAVDAAPLDAGPPPEGLPITCGTTDAVQERALGSGYAGNGWATFTGSNVDVDVSNGAITLTVSPELAERGPYGGIYTSRYYRLRESRVRVEVIAPPTAESGGAAGLTLSWVGSGSSTYLRSDGRNLRLFPSISGGSDESIIPSSPAAHRFLQIRESGGTVYYEISADSVTFTTLHAAPRASWLDMVRVEASIVEIGNTVGPATVVLGGVNLDQVRLPHCDADLIRESFDRNRIRPGYASYSEGKLWSERFSNPSARCWATEVIDGALWIHGVLGVVGNCGIGHLRYFHLGEGGFTVRYRQRDAYPELETGLQIDDSWSADIRFGLSQQRAHVLVQPSYGLGADVEEFHGVASDVRHLRVRHARPTLYFEVSADGESWQVVTTVDVDGPFEFSEVGLYTHWAAVEDGGTAAEDGGVYSVWVEGINE